MRTEGSIVLLISCYELGHQPLGIAWPLAFLKSAGLDAQAMDVSVEPLDVGRIVQARFIGISVPMHTALRLGVRVARRVRQLNPDCPICFFGLYAQLNAEYLLSRAVEPMGTLADFVIGGEYEEELVSLIRAPESSSLGRLQAPRLKRLPFPVPERGLLAGLERYAQLEEDGKRSLAGHVEASRGCKHFCLHCPIPPVYGGRFFVVPKNVVLQDIRQLVQAGARHITFGDPDFLNGPKHSLAIVRAMREEFPGLTFDFTAKIEHILHNRSMFSELGALGCLFVISAVESLSGEVLGHLQKGHVRKDVLEAVSILREAGIALRPSWVAFTPWTKLEDYLDMLDFIEKEDLIYNVDPVQYSIRLLIPPGSLLLSKKAILPFLGELDQANFYYPWKHPDPRMDELHLRVSKVADAAAQSGEDVWTAFYRIKSLALETAEPMGQIQARGLRPLAATTSSRPSVGRFGCSPAGKRPPRLTEAWFCCAEPTGGQLTLLERQAV